MLRGEVRLVDLDPVLGSDAAKRRPAIIVSNDHVKRLGAVLGQLPAALMRAVDDALRLHLQL